MSIVFVVIENQRVSARLPQAIPSVRATKATTRTGIAAVNALPAEESHLIRRSLSP
jgi:hypothetical protein